MMTRQKLVLDQYGNNSRKPSSASTWPLCYNYAASRRPTHPILANKYSRLPLESMQSLGCKRGGTMHSLRGKRSGTLRIGRGGERGGIGWQGRGLMNYDKRCGTRWFMLWLMWMSGRWWRSLTKPAQKEGKGAWNHNTTPLLCT